MQMKLLAVMALLTLTACATQTRGPAEAGGPPGRPGFGGQGFGPGFGRIDDDEMPGRFRFARRHREWDREFDRRVFHRDDCRTDVIRQMPVEPRMYANDGMIGLGALLLDDPRCRGREVIGISVLAFEPDNFLISANGREFGDGRPDRFEWIDLPGVPGRWNIELRQLKLRIADFRTTNIAAVRVVLGGQFVPPAAPPPPPRPNPVMGNCQFKADDDDAKGWEERSCTPTCPSGLRVTAIDLDDDKDGPCEIEQSRNQCSAKVRSKERGRECKVKFTCNYTCSP